NLFLAGLIPGILIMLSLIVTVIVTSRIKNYDIVYKTNIIKWGQRVLKTFKEALLALIMPVIILGGIYSGIFTPTEASVVAVVYGFIVSYFFYREISLKDFIPVLRKSATSSAIILIIVAFASIFAHILTL